MKKVVVTGAAGFVGSAVVKELLMHNIEVFAIDIIDEPRFKFDSSFPKLTYVKLDIFNQQAVSEFLKNKKIDTIYHFAWIGSSGPLRNNIDCQVNNAKMTVNLMKTAKSNGCKRFVCAGTIMENESLEAVYTQGSKPQAQFIYGIGKQLAHSLCKIEANSIQIDLIWAQITNSFGVGELSPRLVNTTIRKCLDKQKLAFTSGTQNYDFIYIDDVANAFYLLGEYGKANKSYVIGSGNAGPLRDFLEKIIYECDKNLKPSFGELPFTGVSLDLSYFSIDEIKKDCAFSPKISFEDGVRKTIEWIKNEERK